jgi:N-acetylmuramoyl-L-alanine amidase
MMGFGGMLNDQEAAAVLSFVRLSFGNSGKVITPAQVAKVRAATKDRVNFYTAEEILKEATKQGRTLGVMLTRETDVNLDFITRAKICNRPDTSCVVSIHFNATDGAKASGSLAVIAAKDRNPDYEIDKTFALGLVTACSKGVRDYLPNSKDMGTIHDSHLHGGIGSNFFFQLQRQPHLKGKPKCFLEIEFIDNAAVEKALLEGDRAGKFRTIAASIAGYLVSATEEEARRKE